MRDRQKKASGSQSDPEFGSFGNRTGFVVGGDRYFGVPGVYLEPHVARRRNHDRAHRQVVGRDGREHQAGALGGDDRTAHAERIGRRAGRRADDQAVAVVGGDHLVVHVRFDRDHARALALEPDILCFDEPTSALDPETTQTILRLLKSIRDTFGITIVVITHEMRVIQQVCTRVAVLDGGLVQEEGRVADIFAHPASRAAKRLLLIEDEEEESYAG